MAPRAGQSSRGGSRAEDTIEDEAVEQRELTCQVVGYSSISARRYNLRSTGPASCHKSLGTLSTSSNVTLHSSGVSVPTHIGKQTLPTPALDTSGSPATALSNELGMLSNRMTEPGDEKTKLTFMSLPPEVRNIIYRYVFYRKHPMRPVSQEPRINRKVKGGRKLKKWMKQEEEFQTAPISSSINFLFASKQIALEGASFVYGDLNGFLLYTSGRHTEAIYNWFVSIGQRNRAFIRTLSIDWSNGVYSTCGSRKELNEISAGSFLAMKKTYTAINYEARLAKRQLELRLKENLRWTVSVIEDTLTLIKDILQIQSLTLSMPMWYDAFTTLAGKRYGILWREEIYLPEIEMIPRSIATLSGIRELTIGPVPDLRSAQKLALQMNLQRVEVFGTDYIKMQDIEDGWVKLPKGADLEERWVLDLSKLGGPPEDFFNVEDQGKAQPTYSSVEGSST